MKLYIDSTDNKKVIIRIDGKEFVSEVDSPRKQNVFSFLMECVKKEGFEPKDIATVEVNPGPGSFTGTRIGVSIANALGFALNLPVNGQKDPIEPIYSSPPSITQPSR